jgi:hypothetical protein
MARLRNPPLRASGVAGTAISRIGLRRGYQVISDGKRNAGNPSPAQIVARLHELIAAKSPEHAALVARWEQKQSAAGPVIHPQVAAWRDRMERYGELREDGATPEEAAGEFGLRGSTAQRYEAHYLAARREDGSLVFPWSEIAS